MQVTMSDKEKQRHASQCVTYHDHVVLMWKDRYQLTEPMDKSNMGTFTLALGYSRFQAFCAEENFDPNQDDKDPLCLSFSFQEQWIEEPEPTQLKSKPMQVDIDLQSPPSLCQEFTKEVEEAVPTEASVKFLWYHQSYGHMSPLRIQAIAKRGILPRILATCPVPVCTACLYGKVSKKPWRFKPSEEEREAVRPVTNPGECVSVNMMTSLTPGLVAQI